MGLRPGDTLDGKYRIERVLGRGGMGTVFEAHHVAIRRRVAVKVLKAALAVDDEMVHRFEREALAASSVRSKHVVEVYDVGTLESGERYMILEYLDGESLSQRLKRGGIMTPAEAFPLAAQLLDGLAAAHDEGIVHRDLKPANIFICTDSGEDVVKVLDFGVSKFSALGGEAFTQTGTLVGTPHYMAPELTEGASKADARSDIYGVGAILFRALTGKTPYTAETIHELIAKLIRQDPKRLADVAPQLSLPATTVVDRALSKDPKARYLDARSMAQAIRDIMTDPSLLVPSSPEDDDGPTLRAQEPPTTPSGQTQPSWKEFKPGGPASPAALGELSASGRGAAAVPPAAGSTPTPVSISGVMAAPEPATPASLPGAIPVPHPPGYGGDSYTGATVLRPENAPEPPTLITPSPATLDSMVTAPPKRSSKAWLVGVGIGALVAVGAGALLIGGNAPAERAPAAAAEPPKPAAQPKPNRSEPDEPAPKRAEEPAPEPSASATPSATPKPTTQRQPATAPAPRPAVPRPPPRVAPPAPPPASRDIREDL